MWAGILAWNPDTIEKSGGWGEDFHICSSDNVSSTHPAAVVREAFNDPLLPLFGRGVKMVGFHIIFFSLFCIMMLARFLSHVFY